MSEQNHRPVMTIVTASRKSLGDKCRAVTHSSGAGAETIFTEARMSQLSSTVERPPEVATGRAGLARRPGYGHPWLTLVAVAFGVMMVGLDATVVAIANPAIARDLNANLSQLQWVTNGYLLALAVSLITA